jgi:D-glycero-alpha-D-manno-heptose-7-phosphate kinase
MILTKAPLRISFFGGGTDLPSFYKDHGGAVLSVAIDKYMYIAINKTQHKYIRLSYSEIEQVQNHMDLKHSLVRNAIEHYSDKYKIGLEIASFADVPTVGTGLGSSSTFSVALIKALTDLSSDTVTFTRCKIAEWACNLEIDVCGSPIGKQDQYAAALGGMNHIRFNQDDSVSITPISLLPDLNEKLLLFYTGRTRFANSILEKQNAEPKTDILLKMREQSNLGVHYLMTNQEDDFGSLLDDAWKLKTKLADGISDPELDNIYEEGIKAGALGGKILGAGGGGYFLFYCRQENQSKLIESMEKLNLLHVNFNFSVAGVETVFNDYNSL